MLSSSGFVRSSEIGQISKKKFAARPAESSKFWLKLSVYFPELILIVSKKTLLVRAICEAFSVSRMSALFIDDMKLYPSSS